MASTINSTGTSSGIVSTGDASGVLNLQGGGNTGVSISATGVPTITTPTISGVMSGVGSNSATTFLGANVALSTPGTVYDVINTGSIGANGQVWLILFIAPIYNTATVDFISTAIWNGSSYIAGQGGYTVGTQGQIMVCTAIVTLSAATTFTGRATAGNTNSYIVTTGNSSLVSNKSCSITAVRLA